MVSRVAHGWLVVVILVAGCTGVPMGAQAGPTDADPGPPETYVFDHADVGAPAIEGGLTYPAQHDETVERYVTTVSSRAEADRFNDDVLGPDAQAFVANTSFEEEYLVVIQVYPASSWPDYEVEAVAYSGGELSVTINRSSNLGTSDITVETVLIRLDRPVPDEITVKTPNSSE